jgi:hypothetical protein
MKAACGPGYWPNETSGVLMPVMIAYIAGERLTPEQVGIAKAYFRQWVDSEVWELNPFDDGRNKEELRNVRRCVAAIETRDDLDSALKLMFEMGMDPL